MAIYVVMYYIFMGTRAQQDAACSRRYFCAMGPGPGRSIGRSVGLLGLIKSDYS